MLSRTRPDCTTKIIDITWFSGKVRLSSLQLEVVLTAIGKENRMKILNISSNDLSSVNPFLISSLGNLLSLNVSSRRLTTVQLEMFITAIEKENWMEIINIAQNDLSSVNMLLISFLGKLLNVNVSHSKLTTAQLEILIIAIEKESVMINIVINGNDLSYWVSLVLYHYWTVWRIWRWTTLKLLKSKWIQSEKLSVMEQWKLKWSRRLNFSF